MSKTTPFTKRLFVRCDQCGHTIFSFERKLNTECGSCDAGVYVPSKDLFVVPGDGDGEVLDRALKMMGIIGYRIATIPLCPAERLFSDQIVFASSDPQSWNITDAMRDEYALGPLERAFEFFSTDFSQYDRVILCHTNNIYGKLLKYVLSYKFLRLKREMYDMDLSCAGKIMTSSGFTTYRSYDSLFGIYDFVVAAANPPLRIKQIDEPQMTEYSERWVKLSQSQTGLCISEGDDVVNVPVDKYDDILLNAVTVDNFTRTPVVVGYALAETENVPDFFLFERLYELARAGKLILQQNTDCRISAEYRKIRKENPVMIQGVYLYPYYAVCVKKPNDKKG